MHDRPPEGRGVFRSPPTSTAGLQVFPTPGINEIAMTQAQEPSASPYRIHLSIRGLTLLLSCCVGILVAAHVALEFTHYRIHELPEALRHLFDLDEESNLPSWYSWTALLLGSGLLFVVAAFQSRRRDRDAIYWWVLAGGFLFLSLDEDASIHEGLNTIADQMGNPNFTWTTAALILVGVLAIFALGFLWRLPPRYRWWFIGAGVAYVFGAVGMEKVSHWWLRAQAQNNMDTLTYNMLSAFEEFLEMASIVFLIRGLLDYARRWLAPPEDPHHAALLPFRFPARRVAGVLGVAALLLVAAHVTLQTINFRVHPLPWLPLDLLDLGLENNVPAWFAAALMLLAAALAGIQAGARRRAGGADAGAWLGLSLGLVAVSIGKDADVLEAIQSLFGINWTIPATVVAVLAALAGARFLWGLPARTRAALLASGLLYLAGALGMEWVERGFLNAGQNADSLAFGLMTAGKQSFEMGAMVILIATLASVMSAGRERGAVPIVLEVAA